MRANSHTLNGWEPVMLNGWEPVMLNGWEPVMLNGWEPATLNGWEPATLTAAMLGVGRSIIVNISSSATTTARRGFLRMRCPPSVLDTAWLANHKRIAPRTGCAVNDRIGRDEAAGV
jgi:hypothetical protein